MNEYLSIVLAILLAASPLASAKPRIEKAVDMPRFSYQTEGKLEELVLDADAFSHFAAEVYRDNQSVLDEYEIADKTFQRRLLSLQMQIDFLEGRYAKAVQRADAIRALEEKPAEKLLSGLGLRMMVAAQVEVGDTRSQAYRKEVGRLVAAELSRQPFSVIENNVKREKSYWEIVSEGLFFGGLRSELQPMVDKAGGAIRSDYAPTIITSRFALVSELPLREEMKTVYAEYIAAHQVEKADIWSAREVELPADAGYAPVRIAIWDTGVDTSIFERQVALDEAGGPLFIAFDAFENPSEDPLLPIPTAQRDRLPTMKAHMKGLSDLNENVDSPEASEVKSVLLKLQPDEFKPVMEELVLAGYYSHGTHVAGIALAGNPYAQLVNGRIEYDYKLQPDPCPTRELVNKHAQNSRAYIEFFRANRVRVVNMSWADSVKEMEQALDQCSTGKTAAAREAMAREYFNTHRNSLEAAIRAAPEILFVAGAGNSNANADFEDTIPAGLSAPNLLTVGAVDQAGDEAWFTSYGPTVKAHANGYQVESYIPGGERVALSGTSMASPRVAGLAAKMLAVNPQLKPTEVIEIILATADTTADGRGFLVHPRKAVAAAKAKKV